MSDADEREAVARAQHWPDLTFWYRLPFSELLMMPHAVRRHYERQLPRLKAEALEAAVNAASFPHMQEKDQKRLIRRIERATGRAEAQVETPKSTEDELRRAAAAGIGVEIV